MRGHQERSVPNSRRQSLRIPSLRPRAAA